MALDTRSPVRSDSGAWDEGATRRQSPDVDASFEQQSAEQLRLTNMVATSIIAGEGFLPVARRTVDEIARLVPACRVSLWLRTGRDRHAVVHSLSTIDFPAVPPGTAVEVDRTRRALSAAAHTVVIDDVDSVLSAGAVTSSAAGNAMTPEEQEIARELVRYVSALGTKAFCSVPLVSAGRPFGAISLGAPGPRRWTRFEVSLIRAVADTLALARLKERAEEKREATARRLGIISAAATAIAAGEDIDQVVQRALNEVVRGLPGTRMSYWVGSRDGQFCALYSCGDPAAAPLTGRNLRPDRGYIRRSEHTLAIEDCERDPATAELAANLRELGMGALIQAPLVRDGRAFGCLAMDAPGPREWSEDEVAMVQQLADTLALGLAKQRADRKRREAEQALRSSEVELRLITDNVSDLIAMVDRNGRRLYNSPSYRLLFDEDVLLPGSDSFAQIHPDDRKDVMRVFQKALASGLGQRAQFRFHTKDARVRFIESHSSVVRSPAGETERVVIVSRDVTERVEAEQRLRYIAHHDMLTGLPNRSLLLDRLDQALALAQRAGSIVAVLFVDLDHFKEVNDLLGHAAGDRLLCDVAHRLKERIRHTDTVARQGGDEFILLLQGLERPQQALAVARKILKALQKPFLLGGAPHSVTCSIGISLSPRDGENADALMKKADIAMYHAKSAGKNACCAFHDDMELDARNSAAPGTASRRSRADVDGASRGLKARHRKGSRTAPG